MSTWQGNLVYWGVAILMLGVGVLNFLAYVNVAKKKSMRRREVSKSRGADALAEETDGFSGKFKPLEWDSYLEAASVKDNDWGLIGLVLGAIFGTPYGRFVLFTCIGILLVVIRVL